MVDYDKPILDENGNPIKIAELAAHHCIRCIKKVKALKKIGYEVHGAGNRVSWGTEVYDTYFVWQDEKQFKNVVKMLIDQGCRILTFDTEPDLQVKWIKEVVLEMNVQDRVKVVADLHDLDSIRKGIIPIPEREMFNYADGLIYVAQPIQSITNRLHKVTMPNITLYSYCNDGLIEYDESAIIDRKGLVYEGGANPPEDTELNRMFSYRSLYDIIKRLVGMGNETYMYCGNITAYDTYQDTGAILFPPTEYHKMMEGMIKYKYGILIFNNEDGQKDQVNYTLSNKMHEYMMAGLPSLTCWCPESEKYVAKHGIGFVFNHIDMIGNCMDFESEYLEVMSNIKIARKKLVMENFIIKIENLYSELLGLEKKGMPDNIKELHMFEYGEEDVNQTLKT